MTIQSSIPDKISEEKDWENPSDPENPGDSRDEEQLTRQVNEAKRRNNNLTEKIILISPENLATNKQSLIKKLKMKSYTTSINKMIKDFDKELKSILENDLKNNKTLHNALVKNLEILPEAQLKTA